LNEWVADVRNLPIASGLDRPTLLDHIPDILDRIAGMADNIVQGATPQLPNDEAQHHADVRLHEGFDLQQVVAEFAILRDCIMRLWEQSQIDPSHLVELRVVNQAIDKAVTASVVRFTRARDRTMMALDRIASEAIESRNLDDLLKRLLNVFVEFTAAVDTAAILIRDGDVLRVRAALGLHREAELGLTIKVGEGFAGKIARERRPISVSPAAHDVDIKSKVLRSSAIRTLYGVALIDGGALLGVAHMGSLTANEFSTQDKRLLSAMANRASMAISQHMLREAAERSSAELSAVLESMPAAIYIGNEQVITRSNRAGLDLLGYEDAEQLAQQPVASLVQALDMRDADTGRRLRPANGPLRTAVRGKHYQRDLVVRDHTNASDVVVHSVAAPIVRDGNAIGAVAVQIDVTARRRMEEVLRERELEFRALADNIPQLVWIADKSGSIYWYNQRWFDYTGTKLADIQGWNWQLVHHPDHVQHVVEKFREAIEREEPWEDTFPLRSKNGYYRWFLSRAVPVRDERGQVHRWFGTSTDVTEQRFLANAAHLLTASLDVTETMEQLANLAVPDVADWCIVDVLRDGKLQRAAAAHIDHEMITDVREWARLYPPDLDDRQGLGAVLRTGEPAFYPEVPDETFVGGTRDPDHLRRLRELGVGSCIIAPLTARGQTLGAISLMRVGSRRRYSRSKLETAIELGRRAGIALDNANLYSASQAAIRTREEILAIVSHDLRNPLAAIDLAATMTIQSNELGPNARKRIEMIERSANRMERLLRDLLDTASIQVGRFAVVRSRESASALVSDAIAAHQPVAEARGVRLVREAKLDGVVICGDRDRLMQAFGNLIGNAIKFSSRGGAVTIRGTIEDSHLEVAIADTGPGITADDLPHIFEPYWSARRHSKQGTGLGLYICKAILEIHAGTVSVESEVGRGTTFVVKLPLADGNNAPC
jgi:PAS domain S-box-containing protein